MSGKKVVLASGRKVVSTSEKEDVLAFVRRNNALASGVQIVDECSSTSVNSISMDSKWNKLIWYQKNVAVVNNKLGCACMCNGCSAQQVSGAALLLNSILWPKIICQ